MARRLIACTVTALAYLMGASIPPALAGEDDVAVIIGNQAYEKPGIPDVDFALRDAAAMKRFAIDVLKIPEENILYHENATQAELTAAFGSHGNPRGLAWRYLDPAFPADLLVYYAGHGVPGQRDKRGYLLPVNADPDAAEINGYPIDRLYDNLAQLPTKSVTVYLDACFSGGSQRGMIVDNASPFGIKVVIPKTRGRMTVITASQGDQIASWDKRAQHGLFTHHLLDGLYGKADRDGDRKVTVAEIERHLRRRMTRAARRIYGRIQNASLDGTPETVLANLPADGAMERPTIPRQAGAPSHRKPIETDRPQGSPQQQEQALRLGFSHWLQIQNWLNVLGYKVGTPDGIPGVETRSALRAFQAARGVTATGYIADMQALAALKTASQKNAFERENATQRAREEELAVYREVSRENRISSYDAYLAAFPNGFYRSKIEAQRLALLQQQAQERAAYQLALLENRAASYDRYLAAYPNGAHASEIRQRRKALLVGYAVDDRHAAYIVTKRSNLRSGPGTKYDRVGRLNRGTRITVTGKVRDKPWYRIEHRGGEAFIWEGLIQKRLGSDE